MRGLVLPHSSDEVPHESRRRRRTGESDGGQGDDLGEAGGGGLARHALCQEREGGFLSGCHGDGMVTMWMMDRITEDC